MAYAALTDLVARFGEKEMILLSDDDNTGTIDEAVVDQVLADVTARIDGYLTDRYSLPLAQVPPALVPLACDLARYLLSTRNGRTRPTEAIKERYDDALTWLGKVAEGKYGLGLTATEQEIPETGGPQFVAERRIFTRRTLHDYVRPPRW
ncbi:MAG TPA: phage protein Gp36 family protein [Aliidongia sp.]|nr:phage protein Gp36 family protein [Aliidongia sp.]